MNKKIIPFTGVMLSIIAVSTFVYSRTNKLTGCEDMLKSRGENHACISTSYGSMVFELYPSEAPKSVERFKTLSNENKFYNGLEFYRVSKDFVVQGGVQDLAKRNSGLQNTDENYNNKLKLQEVKIDTESNFESLNLTDAEKTKLAEEGFKSNPDIKSKPFEYGSLAFANAGPGTNSTEVFIATNKTEDLSNLNYLNGRFTNMGKIVEGADVLDKMNNTVIDEDYAYANGESEKPVRVIEIKEVIVK